MQAAGAIAGQRPALIGRVLPCLLVLAEASGGSAVRPSTLHVSQAKQVFARPLLHSGTCLSIIKRSKVRAGVFLMSAVYRSACL